MNKLSNKQIVSIIFIVAFTIRLAFAIYSYNKNVMANFRDDLAYMNFAENVIEQGPFVLDIQQLDPSAKVVGPGIAWIMSIVMLIFGHNWLPIFILNVFISSLTCVLIYLFALELFNKKVAIISLIWCVFYISFIKYVPTSGKEIWIIFLFTSVIYLTIKLSGLFSS